MKDRYLEFRTAGYSAKHALSAAKTLDRWYDLENEGLVRLEALPDEEPYDAGDCDRAYTNIHGRRVSADEAKKEIREMLERDGCWNIRAEYFDGQDWQHADSIGGCAGYKNVLSPFENWYVPDLMSSAIDAIEAQSLCPAI